MNRENILATLRERIVPFAGSHLTRDVAEDPAQEALMLVSERYAQAERAEDGTWSRHSSSDSLR